MQNKNKKQETLFIVPIRIYTRLMILLFGISIFATYADARVSEISSINDIEQTQLKPPENISIYALPGVNQIQFRWNHSQASVTGFAIYKNGILFDTSSRPFYTDDFIDNVPPTVYEITAFDINGNESLACAPFIIIFDVPTSIDQIHGESVPIAQRPGKDWTR